MDMVSGQSNRKNTHYNTSTQPIRAQPLLVLYCILYCLSEYIVEPTTFSLGSAAVVRHL
jgi:hypothetical protein